MKPPHAYRAEPIPGVPDDGKLRERHRVMVKHANGRETVDSTWRSEAGARDQAAQGNIIAKHYPRTLACAVCDR